MRMMMVMRAREDFEYRNTYNRALLGRIHSDLAGGPYEEMHDDSIGLFSFTGPFPPADAEKGDTRRMLFASHVPEHAVAVARAFCEEPDLNIRGMPLHVEKAYRKDPKVGERGELTTGTPIILRFGEKLAKEYGVESEYERTYWEPSHGMELFWFLVNSNLRQKYWVAFDEEPPEPPYFTGFELERTVAKPLLYDGVDVPHVANEFTFEYEVESAAHRRILNLALDAGLGGLNGTGFGFMDRIEDTNKEGALTSTAVDERLAESHSPPDTREARS